MLKDAGTDVNRKNDVVNHIAETISKINKAEDFSKQQEYIRQSATLLRIDEGGLTNLVNKFIRDKISKDEKKSPGSEAKYIASQETEQAANDAANLFLEDEYQEREIVKRLIEYGNQLLNEDKYVPMLFMRCYRNFI
jgi:DNA primase